MEDSVTYQAILARGEEKGRTEGRDKGRHEMILALAEARLGQPDGATLDALTGIHDPDRLRRIVIAAATANTWADLLSTP